jgi:hypothetical protein
MAAEVDARTLDETGWWLARAQIDRVNELFVAAREEIDYAQASLKTCDPRV